MASSSLLLGSHPSVPEATFNVSVGGGIAQPRSIPAGAYYLDDTSNALSLCYQLANAIQGATGITTCDAWVGRDRTVHVQADAAFTLTWTGDTTARDLLGISADWSISGTTQSAQDISPLLWMPGRPESPLVSPLGTDGKPIWDTKVGMPGTSARVVARQHNKIVVNDFQWRFLLENRVWTASPSNGQFYTFFDEVLRKFYRFKLYRNRTDDSASTADVGLSTGDQLGPYIMRHAGGRVEWSYELEQRNVQCLHPITLPVVVAAEYS